MKNYIFGYGSLIEKESRLRTTPKAKVAFPVKVNGFKRGWFARTGVSGLSTTFLGCVEDKNSHTNGVIYEVSENDIKLTDLREKGYKRVQISFDDIEDFSTQVERNSLVWIYSNVFPDNIIPEENLPSKKYPIVQSYIDICINGCIEIEKLYPKARSNNFAADFILSTQFWNKYWVNDRIYPRRPFIYRPNAYEIDRLLQENLVDKDLFNNIYFE
jgi:hypothetical protein